LAASGTDGRGSRAATAWAATGAAGSIARLPARLSAKSSKSSQQDHPGQHIVFFHAFIPSVLDEYHGLYPPAEMALFSAP
jgi:hypothetical protein